MPPFTVRPRFSRNSPFWPALCLSLILAVYACLSVANIVSLNGAPSGSDAVTYWENAIHFSSLGAVFDPLTFVGMTGPNYWPVGYSAFLAVFGFGPDPFITVRLTQILLGAGVILLTWKLAQRVLPSLAVRISAAAVMAISPTLYTATHSFGYELLLTFLVTLSVYLFVKKQSTLLNGPLSMFLCGGLLGFASLVQFKAIGIAVILGALLLIKGVKEGQVSRFMLFCGGLIGPLATWSARTAIANGSPIPWSRNGPVNLWIGNHPGATGGYVDPHAVVLADGTLASELKHSENGFLRAVIDFALNDPASFVKLQITKFERLFFLTEQNPFLFLNGLWPWIALFSLIFSAVLLLLGALYGAALVWRVRDVKCPNLGVIAATGAYFILVSVPFISATRFRTPAEPFLIVVGAATFFIIIQRWRSQSRWAAREPSKPRLQQQRH